MSDYHHPYTHYVKHILNKSPSKNAFSFGRAERFPTQPHPEYAPSGEEQPCLHANGFTYSKGTSRKGLRSGRQEERVEYPVTPQDNDVQVRKQVDRILQKIERQNGASRSKSRSSSPMRHSTRSNYCQKRTGSPQKTSFNWPQRQSPSPRASRPSPQKGTFYKQLKDLEHPSQNITIGGYYPVGTELSPTGRYASSKIRNVTGVKFCSSGRGHQLRSSREDGLGPGYYNHFSEFGS